MTTQIVDRAPETVLPARPGIEHSTAPPALNLASLSRMGSSPPLARAEATTRIMVTVADEVCNAGLRAILADCDDLEVRAEGTDFAVALKHIQQDPPDVWFTDSCFGGECVLAAIGSAPSRTGVVVFSDHESVEVLRAALEAGALGFVLRRASSATIREAALHAARGCRFVDPTLANSLVGDSDSSLTERETDVLRLFAQGYTTAEIADALFVGKRTVESYRSSVKRKLALTTRAELHRYARHQGLFTPGCNCA